MPTTGDPVPGPAAVPGQWAGSGTHRPAPADDPPAHRDDRTDPGEAAAVDEPVVETGHPAVDRALAGLAEVESAPAAEQVGRFEAVHRALRDTLATIDQT
jgi:hypothetical protein